MINGALKCGFIATLATVIAVCGAREGASTTFQIDDIAFSHIQYPNEGHASTTWRLANLGPNLVRRSNLLDTGVENQLVWLRPSARNIVGRVQPIDMTIFTATPDDRPISDTYDFAGLDPKTFAAIKPGKPKQLPVEKAWAPKSKIAPPPNEALDLGVKTLSYFVMTTKMFFENLSRTH